MTKTHWKRYFDTLAADRINSFVVIFGYENGGFMAPLYPFFFDVKEFPDVEMVGLTKPQQATNAAAFRTLIRLAHERGIEVTAGIWDHIYRGGVQGGGIPGASQNAGKRVPGLVWGVTADNLAPYTKAALRRFLEVFPELDAIQFRMHDESGLKPYRDPALLARRLLRHQTDASQSARSTCAPRASPTTSSTTPRISDSRPRSSTKYWMEQMGLPFHPTHINTEDQRNRRHSYADLLRYPQRYRVHWQLWSGGTTRAPALGRSRLRATLRRHRAPLRRRQLRDQRNARHQNARRTARRKAARHPELRLPLSTITSSNATGTSIASGAA